MSQVIKMSSDANESISSFAAFHQKYSVSVNAGEIRIAERTSRYVLAKFSIYRGEDQYFDATNPSHFHNGVIYFSLSSTKNACKYVYSYDLNKNAIDHILSSAMNPHFFKNFLVNFASGFNRPGLQSYGGNGMAVFYVYDLNIQKDSKQIQHEILKNVGCGGLDGSIDEKKEEIHVFDHVKGGTKTFPLKS